MIETTDADAEGEDPEDVDGAQQNQSNNGNQSLGAGDHPLADVLEEEGGGDDPREGETKVKAPDRTSEKSSPEEEQACECPMQTILIFRDATFQTF